MKRLLVILIAWICLTFSALADTTIPFPEVTEERNNFLSVDGMMIGKDLSSMITPGSNGTYYSIGPAEIYGIKKSNYTIRIDDLKRVETLEWTFGDWGDYSLKQSRNNFKSITKVLKEKYPDFKKSDSLWNPDETGFYTMLSFMYAFEGGGEIIQRESFHDEKSGLCITHVLMDAGKGRYTHCVRFTIKD